MPQKGHDVGMWNQFYIKKTNSRNYNFIDSRKDSRTSAIIW